MTSHSEDGIFFSSCLHSLSYPVCIPYHHLTPPHHTSSEERMLEEESRGSVREWAVRVSLGNCECLWQAAEDKWRHKSVSGEIIGDTWLGGDKKANLKIKEGAGSWLSKISYKFLKNKLLCLQKEVKYAKTKIGRGSNDRPESFFDCDSLSLFLNVSRIVISVTKNCLVLFKNCDIIWKALLLLFILFFVLLLMNCQKGHEQRPKKSELSGWQNSMRRNFPDKKRK